LNRFWISNLKFQEEFEQTAQDSMDNNEPVENGILNIQIPSINNVPDLETTCLDYQTNLLAWMYQKRQRTRVELKRCSDLFNS
jgi:hypothetical protein